MSVARKTEIGPVDGTPVKRMFWSIISDYDLQTGLCELVDNAIDLWTQAKRSRLLRVAIILDADRQLITIEDNAGGVKHEELRLLIAPGGSRNDPDAQLIGILWRGKQARKHRPWRTRRDQNPLQATTHASAGYHQSVA
jgi:hypothetical protein